MPRHVREAAPDDLAAIRRLYAQLHPKDPQLADTAADEIFATILSTPGLQLHVLEDDGEVVATTYLNLIPNLTRGGAPYAVIENVVVDEGRRGSGLGKQLMAATLEAAWDAGCYKVMLMTGSQTPATHAFYRRCGFDPDEKQAYVQRPA
ncbi:GNAT family N-acetyltransferase [Kribbella sp. NPDC004875]|uniref:GNAT family N-acetyltransferase n=1 Tax=Kribbella sp. NPDC004875 TaxID=3364107 RepID=UPI0036BD79D9